MSSPLTWPGPGSAPERLRQLVAFALHHRLPVALWRLPNADAVQLCLSFSAEAALIGLTPALEPTAPAGFAFFPFRDTDHNPPLFLPADVVFDTEHPELLQVNEDAEGADTLAPALREWLHSAPASAQQAGPALAWHVSPQPVPHMAPQQEYAALVQRSVAAIGNGEVLKVVSSRAASQPLPPHFDALNAFGELTRRYPTAFCSLVSAPGAGTWLGATPEILAQVTQDGKFCTMALAGTQPLEPGHKPSEAIWRQKEIEEQALVARYVVSCFKQLRLRDYQETGPRTVAAGEVLHLRTDFIVDLRKVPFPTLGTDMLRLLHPTSAVGGMPRQAALDFLEKHEGYDRAYYSGFLGPVNLPQPGASHLFVNLRCFQLRPTEAILYAGTGLTIDSDPTREWQETELKLRTAGAILQK
ncbi:chorismate-binding protein [Hymenobacter psychrotolerans]|uniref:Isochorismate synthase n=1 Tax=Hymenobacter psychrotolerans DSM 18569 TaxID=1121959 RepID=A0A1M6Y393_9BACT|nr:chorismate-binding protein [Hymenobacter psychrotolerans]SHL12668.1 isochorismate synthase [Hymenobacter psychrotolerans DSM 18569]